MDGLNSGYQLSVPAILKRADAYHGNKEIVTRRPDGSFHRYTYADFVSRAKKLALALKKLGVERSDRVATLSWNHYQHLEAYFGVPCSETVLHTLNLRLHPDDLAYIAGHAEDKVLIVDESLLPLYEKFADRVGVRHLVVVTETGEELPEGAIDYEKLLDEADEADFEYPEPDETTAAAMCYTSGTTGRPKGALYSHREIALLSLTSAMVDTLAISASDVVLPVVPMFHANAWNMPFTCTLVGAKQVFPGPYLDGDSLLEIIQQERVTFTAGVPTIWLDILRKLDERPEAYDLSSLRTIAAGGSAAPEGMIRAFEERHGLKVLHAWGMTEIGPVTAISNPATDPRQAPENEHYKVRAKQGPPVPFLEARLRAIERLAPWDGESMGELEMRGAYVARSYYNTEEGTDKFTEDGWFKTGDIATVDRRGYIEIQDRTKDLIKSGGEWISSMALENALMAHPAVAEAAVIAVPHTKWQERPLAVVVLKDSKSATQAELINHLKSDFAKWWLPDAVEFVDEIPKTSTGKFLKTRLRRQFEGYALA